MSMGRALREVKGGGLEVLTRVKDFNIQSMDNGQGQQAIVPSDTLVAFNAVSFRELPPESASDERTDVWEFRVMEKVGNAMAPFNLYLRGEDIFLLRVPSQVAI
jgi:hypothetical protein